MNNANSFQGNAYLGAYLLNIQMLNSLNIYNQTYKNIWKTAHSDHSWFSSLKICANNNAWLVKIAVIVLIK